MPVDAFEKTGDPKDLGSAFLTKEEKAEIKEEAKGKRPEVPDKKKK